MATAFALHEAFVAGDVSRIRALLGEPEDFPNSPGPDWLGDLLIYAIYWSPLSTIEELLALGADACVEVDDGFPPLIAATDRDSKAERDDRVEVVRLLLQHGADPNVRGLNDGTSLHHVVWKHQGWSAHLDAVRVLLESGADPHLKTRIDDCTSPLEDAEAMGAPELASLLRAGAPES